MSWRDRPYADDSNPQMPMRVHFRKPSSVVMWLIIINVAVFFLDVLSQHFSPAGAHYLFGLSLNGIKSLFIWQLVTYMFLHFDVMHLLINMLLLYVCGSEFERAFGKTRFLQFYVICGVMGGLAYLMLALIDPSRQYDWLIGASGAGYGLLLAAIILFPHIQVILFIIPMPIRVFGLIVAAMLLLKLISPGPIDNLGGEVCHVAGALTGLVVFKAWGMLPSRPARVVGSAAGMGFGQKFLQKRREGVWARKQKQLAEEVVEVDRILTKIRQEGIASLTRAEKKILGRATQRQQQEERRFGRNDRV